MGFFVPAVLRLWNNSIKGCLTFPLFTKGFHVKWRGFYHPKQNSARQGWIVLLERVQWRNEQDIIARVNLSILELAKFLKNVSQACRIIGVSHQHFYDIKISEDENGIEGLTDKTRRKPCIKNRVTPEVETAVVKMAFEYWNTEASSKATTSSINPFRKLVPATSLRWVRRVILRSHAWLFHPAAQRYASMAGHSGQPIVESAILKSMQKSKCDFKGYLLSKVYEFVIAHQLKCTYCGLITIFLDKND